MKKIFILDTILLLAVILIFAINFAYLTIPVAMLYVLILIIYTYINMILKNTSMTPLKYKGNYWTYLGLPFILLGKTYFISVMLSNIEGSSTFNNIMNIILVLQTILPSFNLVISSYITSDNKLLYQGRKIYSFNEFENHVAIRKTLGVNIILGYLKNGRVLYIVLSDKNRESFDSLYEKSNKEFNWNEYIKER